MAVSAEQIRAVVEEYVRLVAIGSADQIVALYAADATVEDPVGSEVRRGREAIRAFYAPLEAMAQETRLLAVRIAGSEAAFHFEILSRVDGAAYTLSPIDHMAFDEDGQIASMRAFWAEGDLVVG